MILLRKLRCKTKQTSFLILKMMILFHFFFFIKLFRYSIQRFIEWVYRILSKNDWFKLSFFLVHLIFKVQNFHSCIHFLLHSWNLWKIALLLIIVIHDDNVPPLIKVKFLDDNSFSLELILIQCFQWYGQICG